MRRSILAVLLVTATLVGCVGDDGPVRPDNPFPARFGLRLDCMDPVPTLQACTVPVHAGPANEVTIAVDPTDPARLLAGSKDYTLGAAEECGGTRVWSGVYTSADHGATWSYALFPGHPGGPDGALSDWPCVSDPVVGFAPDGTAYYSGLAYDLGGAATNAGADRSAIWIAASPDGGTTWADPVFVARADEGEVFVDKQWFVTGADGTLVMVWQAIGSIDPAPVPLPGGPVVLAKTLFSASADGGATWSPARPLFELDTRVPTDPKLPDFTTLLTHPTIDAEGNVYVVWTDAEQSQIYFTKGSRGAGGAFSFAAARSIHQITPIGATLPNTQFRTLSYPVLEADPTLPGALVLVWADAREGNADIMVSRSSDGGATWTTPMRLNDDETTNAQWMPWLDIDDAGGVHIVWFDRRDDPGDRLIDLYYAYSPDGSSFLTNVRVTPTSFDGDLGQHQTGVPFIGDYIGVAVGSVSETLDDGRVKRWFEVHPIWPDTRDGTSAVYTARLVVHVGRPGQV